MQVPCARALDADHHGVVRHRLPQPDARIADHERACVEVDAQDLVQGQASSKCILDISRDHANPVRIVTAQIGLYEVARHKSGLAFA
jgi:hypothetical protein